MLSKSRPLNSAVRHPRHAFTLIELLVTVGIILVLMGIVLVAVRRVGITSKEHATHVTLANLQSMLNDYGATTGFKTEPSEWIWNDASWNAPTTLATTPPVTTNFWTTLNYSIVQTPPVGLEIAGPPTVTTDAASTNMRVASPAVLNTLVAMNLICRLPANRTAMANMPPQTLLVPTLVVGQVATPGQEAPPNPQFCYGIPGGSTANIIYPIGCHIQYNGKYFVCLNQDSGPPTAGANWRDEAAAPQSAPLVLDAWGNPIIYVPGGGLNVLLLKSHSTYVDPGNPPYAYADRPQVITSPDNRPFWASAGPDGDFSHGDDNIYSFEQ